MKTVPVITHMFLYCWMTELWPNLFSNSVQLQTFSLMRSLVLNEMKLWKKRCHTEHIHEISPSSGFSWGWKRMAGQLRLFPNLLHIQPHSLGNSSKGQPHLRENHWNTFLGEMASLSLIVFLLSFFQLGCCRAFTNLSCNVSVSSDTLEIFLVKKI